MSYQVLSRQNHQNLRLRATPQPWAFARDRAFVGLVAAELAEAVRAFPVAFRVQGEQAGMVGLLGFGKQNLFIDDKGQWQGSYIPGVLRAWPFALVRKDDQQVVVVDTDADRLSDTDGELLFTENGEPGERLQKIIEFLRMMAQQEMLTQRGVASIRQLELLEPWEPVVKKADGQPLKLQGLHQVDQKRFGELSDEDFLTLRREGGLPLIYAHALSLRSIHLLEKLAQKQPEAPIQANLPPTIDLSDEYLKF